MARSSIWFSVFVGCVVVSSCLVLAAAQQPTGAVMAANTTCGSTTSKPVPTVSNYVFSTCIVAKFAAYLSIGQGKYVELKNGTVSNSSQCGDVNSTTNNPKLIIDFGPCAQLELEMGKTAVNATEVHVKAINGTYKIANETTPFSNSTGLFHTTLSGHYYKCNAEQPVILNKADNILMLSNFAYEVYRTAPGTDFYQIPEECALDSSQVSDLVRIGVGICLVALVVIVLIAYFVGRRRWSERSSYESV